MTDMEPEGRSFWEHVGVLRSYILVGGFSYIAMTFVVFGYDDLVVKYILARPLSGQELVFLSPMGPFLFEVNLAFLAAAVIVFPLWLYLLARFTREAIPEEKRRGFYWFVLAAALAGYGSLAASVTFLVPASFKAFQSFVVPGTTYLLAADSYVAFFFLVSVVGFVIVELPVVIAALAYTRLVSPYALAKHRRWLYVAVLVLLGLVTPTPDPVTLLMVTVPALVLAELGIVIGKHLYAYKLT